MCRALPVALLFVLSSSARGDTAGALGVYVRGPAEWVPGTPASLRLATHLATAPEISAPLGNVALELTLAGPKKKKQVLWRGTSSASGDAQAQLVVPDWPAGTYQLTVAARAGGRSQLTTQAIELAPGARLFLSSDKPLYQPGQPMHLRGLAVRAQDGRPLTALDFAIEVEDPRGNRVFYQDGKLSEFGVATADFTLADEISLGDYTAKLLLGDESATLGLRVERYTLPRFKIGLVPDRGYYRAGQKIRLAVDTRYFFGKPVAGGEVKVVAFHQPDRPAATLRGRTDAAGKLTFEHDLPADQAVPVRFHAEVTDASGFRQRADIEVPVTREALAVEIVAEAGSRLRPGIEQRVWVVANRPDGTAAANAEVEVGFAGKAPLRARTDALGVAEVTVAPPAGAKGCLKTTATVTLTGDKVSRERCLDVAAESILVRTDRAIYDARVPLAVEVIAPGAGAVWVDVLREGQVVDGGALALTKGRGQMTFPVAPHLGGTLTVHAYVVRPDGQAATDGDARLIYLAPPAALRVELRPAAAYRPGDQARFQLRVSDAASGGGVRASVGVAMVDQAVLALRAARPGSARVLITLGEIAAGAGRRLAARPGGLSILTLVEELVADAGRQRAARILFADAVPDREGFEIDPWAARVTAWAEQEERLAKATERWVSANAPGERFEGQWVWRRDLAERMVATGGLARADARDPWGRPVPTARLAELAALGDFDDWAEMDAGRRMSAIYAALRGRPPGPIGLADLEAAVAAGKLRRGLLRDPWGGAFRVVEGPRERTLLGVRSLWVVVSNGPDRAPGTKDDLYPKVLIGGGTCGYPPLQAVDRVTAYGMAMGAVGCGYGSGGHGAVGISSPPLPVGAGRASEPGGGDVARVRRSFPETMLWLEATTDERGEATVDATMADSITTWKLSADAIAADGRLGSSAVDVRVMQDFFVDVDLPGAVTQGDELSIPVAVHNYLPGKQKIRLAVEPAAWFTLAGPGEQILELGPDQVGAGQFRIRARDVGRHTLLVKANGSAASDAVERATEVHPDGVERSVAFQSRLERRAVRHEVVVPPGVIDGTPIAMLKVYPTSATHALEGLDSILQMPSGCFEQTSSSTYPNLLVLDYLRRARKSSPAVEKRARQYIGVGYQRLLSFEVKGGGFSWFGDAPANQVLTAYGLEEFYDMKRVHPVDPRVITRTQEWLAQQQKADGGFAPDTHIINDGVTEGFEKDRVRITAFIALALARTGGSARAVERAKAFVRRGVAPGKSPDAYTLALAAELLGPGDPLYAPLIESLWRARKQSGDTVTFELTGKTPTRSAGKSADVETSARAALAMLRGPGGGGPRSDQLIASLAGAKDSFGTWYSTQATIRSLQALLRYGETRGKRGSGVVTVEVDGVKVGAVKLASTQDSLEVLALPAVTRPGKHVIDLGFAGTGAVEYQLVARWHEPRSAAPPAGEISVSAKVDRSAVAVGDTVSAEVKVSSTRPEPLDMLMVTAGLPPGFDPDDGGLARLVDDKVIEKYERTPRGVVFYLGGLPAGKTLVLPLRLSPRFPSRVQMPAPSAWEYYRPERRGEGVPLVLESRP